MMTWRLIVSGYGGPCRNMAVDEAILRSYVHGSTPPVLRIYGWRPAAISLGVFQKPSDVLHLERCADAGIIPVRRITGGEAIFHGTDISYSIICSTRDLSLPSSVKESFKTLTGFLIELYKSLGLDPYFFSDRRKSPLAGPHSDFCFALNQDFDIAVGGKKIGGNAQKRRRETIFQHGSIPLLPVIEKAAPFFKEDIRAMESNIASIAEIAPGVADYRVFEGLMTDLFQRTFGVTLARGGLTDEEETLAALLAKRKYGADAWNRDRLEKEIGV